MTLPSYRLDPQHKDIMHDVQLDYYSKRLATCSSDRTIRVFEIESDQRQPFIQVLKGHEGPVWQVAWAHPKFGSILASCSYDGHVFLWKEDGGKWIQVKDHAVHDSSVNSIAWAHEDFGLVLACGSSDGHVSILRFSEGQWTSQVFHAHQIGCSVVAWAPPPQEDMDDADGMENVLSLPSARLASGGYDHVIRFWRWDEAENRWVQDGDALGHTDWVRDLAWAPSMGLPISVLASCTQDKQVMIWTSENGGPFVPKPLQSTCFPDVVWKVSWSPMGLLLAVSYGDNKVSLWKESLDGEWSCQNTLDENAQQFVSPEKENTVTTR